MESSSKTSGQRNDEYFEEKLSTFVQEISITNYKVSGTFTKYLYCYAASFFQEEAESSTDCSCFAYHNLVAAG